MRILLSCSGIKGKNRWYGTTGEIYQKVWSRYIFIYNCMQDVDSSQSYGLLKWYCSPTTEIKPPAYINENDRGVCRKKVQMQSLRRM